MKNVVAQNSHLLLLDNESLHTEATQNGRPKFLFFLNIKETLENLRKLLLFKSLKLKTFLVD